MKIEGNTIILNAGEQITIKSQETAQVAQPAAEPVQTVETASELKDNQIRFVIKNDTSKTALFAGYLRLVLQGDAGETDFCFRDTRYYPADGSAGHKLYKKGVAENGYLHGANTDQLAPGQSLSITFSKRMEAHSGSNVTPAVDVSTLFGRYFKQTTPNDLGNIKLSVAIDRNIDNPNRVDNYPSYYSLRFTDKDGNVLSNNPQIQSKGTYYLSIYDTRQLYNPSWGIMPYDHKDSDTINTAYVTVQ